MLGKVFAWTTLQNAIFNDLIDPGTKQQIYKFDKELDKRLDDTNFVDDVRADLYIDNADEVNEVEHGDGSNNLSDEAYENMKTEELPE